MVYGDDPQGTDGFADLLVHPGNREAVEACRAVAERRWTGGKPLVLWGPYGCSKSHLLRAVEMGVRARVPGVAVVRVDEEMVAGLSLGAELPGDALLPVPMEELDLLLVDGLNLMSWPGGLQRWLARTLLGMREGGGQAVVAVDELRAPDFEKHSALDTLANLARFVGRPLEVSTALKSLIGAGHFVRLGLPDEPARRELLARYAQEWRIEVPEEALGTLARRLPGEVVLLRCAIDRLSSHLRREPGGFQPRWADEVADWITAGPEADDGVPVRERVEAVLEEYEALRKKWGAPETARPRRR